jgi:chromosome segregation ATPase
VRAFVTRLNIQTDNLCQFLPQDKVHEFSKMAPKALMHKTIDAVGEEELKDDHKRLMEMQTELDEGEASFAAKEQRLRDCEQKKEGLEQEVKNFRERKELEGSIELHGKRKEWAIYDERRRACKELRAVYKEATDKLRKEEERLEPLKRKMTECKAGRARTDQSIKSKITSGSQCLAEAKTASQRVEAIEEDLDGIDADQERNEAREEQRKEEQRNLEESVAALRQQLEEEEVRAASSADNGGAGAIKVQEEIANKMRELHTIEENKVGIDQSLGQNRYEATAANNSVRQSEQRIAQLQNVRSQMVDKIAKMPGGRDIVKAMDWLSNNREKFKGRVYDPVLTQISVTDPRYSVYLEQLVAFKDLVAFGADEISDVNLLMNQMRRMGTKVNVFHARRAGNELNPTVPGESFDRKCEFKGYAADLFTAPAAIKEHLCRMYKLHNTPVFGKGAEKIVESLIEKYQFRVFFIDRERYNCVKSKYMNGVTTSIDKLREPRNYFTAAVDKNRLRQLQAEIAKSKKQKDELAEQEEQMKAALTDASREADELKKEVKNLKQRQERVSIVKTRIKSKETKLKEFLAAAGNRDLKRAKRELAVRRARLEAETLEMADKLKRVVVDGNNIKIKLEVEKVK